MIRRAIKKDIPGLDRLLYQVNQVHADIRPDLFISGKKKYTDEELKEILGREDTPVFVYTDEEDEVLGYAFLVVENTFGANNFRDDKMIYIDDICVDEKARGRHVASELCAYVRNWAAKEGYDRLTLNVWTGNDPAVAFYDHMGFKPLKTVMEMKLYSFYGWEKADCFALTDTYPQIRTPLDLYDALADCWDAQTCAPRMRGGWNKENRTLGQCSITAFLAQDIFGGEVRGILRPGGNYHCYNVVGERVFDLTSEQFGDEVLDYTDNPLQERAVHFAKEEKRLRYEELKRRLAQWCKGER